MRTFWLLLLLVAIPGISTAQDYASDSTSWNGLNQFFEIGVSNGVGLVESGVLEYSTLKRDPQPLVFIYPKASLDVRSLTRYVVDGGRIVVFDDFGESEELLSRLEITRVIPSPGNLPHDTFLNENPALPAFEPVGRHPLLDGVEKVVANHPAVLSNSGGPVVGYTAGGALVYDMNLGKGKVVVVGDASLVINRMLEVEDNAVLVGNALRYVCAGRDNPADCQPRVLVGDFTQSGSYGAESSFDPDEDVADTIDAINEGVASILEALPFSELLYYMSILIAAGLAVYLATVFPLRRTRPYSAYVTDFFETIPEPQSEFDWNLSRFGRGSRTMNHALPMSILKELFEELFLTAFDLWPSDGDRPDVTDLARMYDERFLTSMDAGLRRKRRESTRELLGVLAQIPPRNRVFLDSEAHFSEADLLKFHRMAMETLSIMGLDDEYERRTRGA